jgi:hypothetical protein
MCMGEEKNGVAASPGGNVHQDCYPPRLCLTL